MRCMTYVCVRAFACTKRMARALQVVTALGADAWGDWEAAKFAPEEKFLEKIKAISGISQVSHYRKRVPYENKKKMQSLIQDG